MLLNPQPKRFLKLKNYKMDRFLKLTLDSRCCRSTLMVSSIQLTYCRYFDNADTD